MNYSTAKRVRFLFEKLIHWYQPESIFKSEAFPWARPIEAAHPEIKKEALQLMHRLPQIVNFNYVLPGQKALAQDDQWKSFFLVGVGEPILPHQEFCPETTKALKNIPNLINAFFSIFVAGTHVPAHRGPFAGILRFHLGVIIPEGDQGIRIEKTVYRWREGESLFFDDSFEHEAWNHTASERVVLFVDLERPLPWPLSAINRFILRVFRDSNAAKKAYQRVWTNLLPKAKDEPAVP